MHLGKLVGEDREDRGLVVNVGGEVHVDLVCASVGILGRVYTREVLVLHEDRAVCRGERSEGERDVFVDFAGVERCVVVFADVEGGDVGSRRL